MKPLKIAFIIVGAKIGAGFASGKEIFEYFAKFGAKSLLFVPLLFFAFYFFTYTLLCFGSKFLNFNLKDGNNLLSKKICVFNKTFNMFNAFMFVTFLILSAAMFTGLISLFGTYFPNASRQLIYFFVVILTIVLIKMSFNTISSISYIIVPMIIVCILINAVFSLNLSSFTSSLGSYGSALLPMLTILYASQNTFLASFVIIKSGSGLCPSEQKKVSLIVAVILCSLIVVGILCFLFNPSLSYFSMPFAEISKEVDVVYSYIFGFIIFSSIITTYATTITSLKEYFKNKRFTSIYMLCTILLLSTINFSHIVKYLYPLIGVFGLIYIYKAYTACNLSFKSFFQNTNKSIHNASQNAKDNS